MNSRSVMPLRAIARRPATSACECGGDPTRANQPSTSSISSVHPGWTPAAAAADHVGTRRISARPFVSSTAYGGLYTGTFSRTAVWPSCNRATSSSTSVRVMSLSAGKSARIADQLNPRIPKPGHPRSISVEMRAIAVGRSSARASGSSSTPSATNEWRSCTVAPRPAASRTVETSVRESACHRSQLVSESGFSSTIQRGPDAATSSPNRTCAPNTASNSATSDFSSGSIDSARCRGKAICISRPAIASRITRYPVRSVLATKRSPQSLHRN